MKVTFLGTRGTYPSSNPSVKKYGGSTPCIEIKHKKDRLILDAGTGILGVKFKKYIDLPSIHILLTHLHMDHIQGLGYFKPLFIPGKNIHIWGPSSSFESLRDRLNRFLSPPIFPFPLRDIPCNLQIHEISNSEFQIGPFQIKSDFVIHPGPTVGYRIECDSKSVVYLPDHEPMIGTTKLYSSNRWVSGYHLCKHADVLIHDAHFSESEYEESIGWGHSSVNQAVEFARRTNCKKLFLFHHHPEHSDEFLEQMLEKARNLSGQEFDVILSKQGKSHGLG